MNITPQSQCDDERIFTKSFFLIFTALLFTALVMYALMSTVTEYASSMGSSATIAGLVSGIYIFGGLCSRIYSANALNRKDWKRLALIFLAIHFLACILYFFADNTVFLVIVRFIHGLGFGAASNAIVTTATEILPKKRFGEAFGYFMLGTTIAVGLGPYIGGFFYDIWGADGSFLLAAIFSAIAFVSMYMLDLSNVSLKEDDSKRERNNSLEKLFEIKAIPVSLFTALTALGYVSILSFYRLYAVEVDLVDVFSIFFLIYSIVLLASRPVAGRIQDNHGDKFICIFGIVVQAIGLFLIAYNPNTITVIACAVCAALGFGTLNSVCATIVTRNASLNRRSYAISTFYVFCDGTIGFGPALLGCFVSASSGYAPIYYIAPFITILALPVCLYALKK